MERANRVTEDRGDLQGSLTPVEALAGVAYCALFADGTLNEEEEDDLQTYLWKLNAFRNRSELELQAAFDRMYDLADEEGDDRLLERCAGSLPDELKPTAYFLATDLVMGDGAFVDEESRFLDALRTRLDLDDHTTQTIHEALAYKYRG